MPVVLKSQNNLQLVNKITHNDAKDATEAFLGEGSFGRVYCARERDGRLRAVKQIDAGKWMREKNATKRQIQAEVKSWVALEENPHIVKLYSEWGWPEKNEQFLYISMQYCRGGDLHSQIKNTKLPLPKIVDWMKQLAKGVAWMHGKGIVHRDLYTKNIFIDDQNNIRIGDFGLARPENPTVEAKSAVQTMQIARGYVPFFSPERVNNMMDHKTSYPDDCWCIGMIALELFNGVDICQDITKWSSFANPIDINKEKLKELKENIQKKHERVYAQLEGLFERKPQKRTTAVDLVEKLSYVGQGARCVTAEFANRVDGFVEQVRLCPVQSLKESLRGVIKHHAKSGVSKSRVQRGIEEARTQATKWVNKRGKDVNGLDIEEMAAIHLYTQTCIYSTLNAKLRSGDLKAAKVFFPYARLLLSALDKLPDVKDTTLYRGIDCRLPKDCFKQGTVYPMQQFNSCSSVGQTIESFLKNNGYRTVMTVLGVGKNIKKYSKFDEAEVLVPFGTLVRVDNSVEVHSGKLCVVSLSNANGSGDIDRDEFAALKKELAALKKKVAPGEATMVS